MNTTTLIGLITVIGLAYYFVWRQFSYWHRKGVPFVPPSIPRGNFGNFGKIHQGELIQGFYNQMKGQGKFFGIYGFHNPIAIASDPEFIKQVMIKDFAHFQDRGMYTNERDDPLSAHLFSIGGAKWRRLRAKLTPTFTSGKMKFMYPTVIKVAKQFHTVVDEIVHKNNGSADVEIKDLLSRFTTDVIGECAFGMECNSLKDSNNEFREMGRKMFENYPGRFIKFMMIQMLPKVSSLLRLKVFRSEAANFFMGIVKQTVNYRESNNIKRNDFMDLMLKLKHSTTVDDDGNVLEGVTMDELAAQAFVFFVAGFETSSTVMTYALHELAVNKELQERARDEIKSVLAKHNGVFSYEAMLDMSYIDQILQGWF